MYRYLASNTMCIIIIETNHIYVSYSQPIQRVAKNQESRMLVKRASKNWYLKRSTFKLEYIVFFKPSVLCLIATSTVVCKVWLSINTPLT